MTQGKGEREKAKANHDGHNDHDETPDAQCPTPPHDCIAIVGVGLIGGSLGMALRAKGLAQRVIGIDRNAETLEKAKAKGAIDEGFTDIAAVREADIVFLATSVRVLPEVLADVSRFVNANALVTDTGSTKVRIVADGERLLGERFVGGHPMAGSEKGGIAGAKADLFENAAWIVVPSSSASQEKVSRLVALISALNARPLVLAPAQHDRLVALVSHLPHLLSFAFAQTVGNDGEAALAQEMAGGSYRDLMRVASSDPVLWADIFGSNKDAIREVFAVYEQHLNALRDKWLS